MILEFIRNTGKFSKPSEPENLKHEKSGKLETHIDKEQRELIHFFFLSFYFTQGRNDIQPFFFYYAQAAFPEKFTWILNHPRDVIPSFLNVPVPSSHISISQETYQEELLNQWGNMYDAVASSQPLGTGLLSTILERLIIRDNRKAAHSFVGRKTLLGTDDKFSSFVRDYIVIEKSTKNQIFDQLFLDLKKTLGIYKKSKEYSLMMLVRAWEEKHPGESFWEKPVNND